MVVPAAWHTRESARAEWPDAPLSDDTLDTHLEIGKTDVISYGKPRTWSGEWPPVITPGIREAQLRAARNAWNDGQTDANNNVGPDGYQIPAPFLRWHHLVRPAVPLGFV